MDNLRFSRRNFISALGVTGAATVANLSPLQSLAGIKQEEENVAPDREIKMISTIDLSPKEQEKIRSVSKNVNLQMVDNASAIADDAEVVIGDIDAASLQRLKKLKWVQVWHAGVENMPKEMIAHPVVLTNMQRVLGPVIAESAIGLLLSLTRGLIQSSVPNFYKKKWAGVPGDVVLDDLFNKTIAIVGMGGIGSETARRLHYGFNMRVIATDAKPMHKPDFVDELHDPSWLLEMVPKADVLMSAAPLTKQTKEMFNAEVFGKMKRDAYFINVSRGGLVQQSALIDALKNKKIRGAGLDVTTPEPLPADHELWTCPNLVITPHNSSVADVRNQRMLALAVENVRRYTLGLPLMNVVDKEKGY
jgi:phosphoglycerate dehydrogenase-like enzyme